MKTKGLVFLLTTFFCFYAAAQTLPAIIPAPISVLPSAGTFVLSKGVVLQVPLGNDEVKAMAQRLADRLLVPTGIRLLVADHKLLPSAKSINFVLNAIQNQTLGQEGYVLEVKKTQIIIKANTTQGLFYGVQTLLQLLPKEIESKTFVKKTTWLIPCVGISDYPRFGWRGMMLDVSRHFFDKNQVKQFIDEMARYKYNVFHWHLSDDQGWRVEIKAYPALTQKGAWRVARTGDWWERALPQEGEEATYGGFYTQNDIKEIVAYAKERYIDVLPEIDVPGHSLAVIACFPELSCSNKPVQVNGGWRFYNVDDNGLNPSNPKVYEFLDKVFAEVAGLFPYGYIHIGGDECTKKFWKECNDCQAFMKKEGLKDEKELQSYFIKKVEKIVESKGKKMIGWDEILEGGLSPNATVMSWREMKGGIEAAKQGHSVVMTPWSKCYIDLYQGDMAAEPKTYGMSRLTNAYNWDPVPEGINPNLILGGQANLWTESVPNTSHAQYMTWPRGMALAEVYWSSKERKNWPDFVNRVESHFERFDMACINYAESMFDPILSITKKSDNGRPTVELSNEINGITIHYSTDNTFPDKTFPKYEKPIELPKGAYFLRLASYKNGKKVGKMISIRSEELESRAKKVP